MLTVTLHPVSRNILAVTRRQITTSAPVMADQDSRARNFTAQTIMDDEKKGVFRVLTLGKTKDQLKKSGRRRGEQEKDVPHRSQTMRPDQRWGNVWPAARTFHPSVVPLPVRQGVIQTKAQVVPSKFANTELMKIPNFLHLTPPVIKEHCAAISKFCTEWPAGLETEEEVEKHFPITVTSSDYLNSSSSIRDRRSRIVQLRVNVDSLPLDDHARDKLIRLVGPRYDEETGEILLTSDRCPYRGQNEDYCKFLLRALFAESWTVEEWETKNVEDRELFVPEDEVKDGSDRGALKHLLNVGEDQVSITNYKEEVRKLLGLPETIKTPEIVNPPSPSVE